MIICTYSSESNGYEYQAFSSYPSVISVIYNDGKRVKVRNPFNYQGAVLEQLVANIDNQVNLRGPEMIKDYFGDNKKADWFRNYVRKLKEQHTETSLTN